MYLISLISDSSRFQETSVSLSFSASSSITFLPSPLRSSEKNLQLLPEVKLVDMGSEESVGPEVVSEDPEMESVEKDFFPDKVINPKPS